jgi:hypothetical protein
LYIIFTAAMKLKLLRILPFAILFVITAYAWLQFLTTIYFPTLRHHVALALIIINFILYFFRYKFAVLFTGLILILATFNIIAFLPVINIYRVYARLNTSEVHAPIIQSDSLLMLILYLIINAKFVYINFLAEPPKR